MTDKEKLEKALEFLRQLSCINHSDGEGSWNECHVCNASSGYGRPLWHNAGCELYKFMCECGIGLPT